MTLDADYLEALLKPMGSSTSLMCRLSPRNEMAIIKGFASNAHNFKKSDFFVRPLRRAAILFLGVDGVERVSVKRFFLNV